MRSGRARGLALAALVLALAAAALWWTFTRSVQRRVDRLQRVFRRIEEIEAK